MVLVIAEPFGAPVRTLTQARLRILAAPISLTHENYKPRAAVHPSHERGNPAAYVALMTAFVRTLLR
jgi:hypothetical protein